MDVRRANAVATVDLQSPDRGPTHWRSIFRIALLFATSWRGRPHHAAFQPRPCRLCGIGAPTTIMITWRDTVAILGGRRVEVQHRCATRWVKMGLSQPVRSPLGRFHHPRCLARAQLRIGPGRSSIAELLRDAQVGRDPNERRIPTDTDIVGDLGCGLVEVAALRWEAQEARVVGEVRGRPGVRPTGQRAWWRRRKRGIEIVAKLTSTLVTAVVGAVAGDVTLTERIPTKEIVHANRDGIHITGRT